MMKAVTEPDHADPAATFSSAALPRHAVGPHANEGLVEWPPSPWRLLRALLATGYTAHYWDGNLEKSMASSPSDPGRSLIGKLASVLPRYRMPVASGAHSRHFMPLAVIDKGREKTMLVFDTFAQIEDGAIAVTWDVTLDATETDLLAALVSSLNSEIYDTNCTRVCVDCAEIANNLPFDFAFAFSGVVSAQLLFPRSKFLR